MEEDQESKALNLRNMDFPDFTKQFLVQKNTHPQIEQVKTMHNVGITLPLKKRG